METQSNTAQHNHQNNDKKSSLLRSILTTGSISTVLSIVIGLFSSFSMIAMIATFLTTVVLQFVLFYYLNLFLSNYMSLEKKKLENEQIKEMMKQSLEVECPSCKEKQFVPIFVNLEMNKFTCPKCKSENVIKVETIVAKLC